MRGGMDQMFRAGLRAVHRTRPVEDFKRKGSEGEEIRVVLEGCDLQQLDQSKRGKGVCDAQNCAPRST